tara:strand:- start:806 stop:1159 length:354 start_codon:yes stop_codon:yes gene_type:complete
MKAKEFSIKYDSAKYKLQIRECQITGDIHHSLIKRDKCCSNCNKPLMNTPDDWRIVSYSNDMQTMTNDRLTLKRQYYNIEALDISANEVLMCKFCATNPEMRDIAREHSKYNNNKGE